MNIQLNELYNIDIHDIKRIECMWASNEWDDFCAQKEPKWGYIMDWTTFLIFCKC